MPVTDRRRRTQADPPRFSGPFKQRGEDDSPLYDGSFYEAQIDGSRTSAALVLDHLFERWKPASLADVGCGRGAWLAAAESLGVQKLHGVDGPWVTTADLLSRTATLHSVDLQASGGQFSIGERSDMVICVEVAEHLTESAGRSLVRSLCATADVVLFSAAVPGQGGVGHINLQWQSYWTSAFEEHGYTPIDALRPALWSRSEIRFWYRQNCLLYVNRNSPLFGQLTERDWGADVPLDLGHPEMVDYLQRRLDLLQAPGVKDAGRRLLLAVGQRSRRMLKSAAQLRRHREAE